MQWVILTFPSLCRCSDGIDHLHGGTRIHCTPSKLSSRSKEKKLGDPTEDFNCLDKVWKLLTLPAPAQSLQGFLPIPTQAWHGCVIC